MRSTFHSFPQLSRFASVLTIALLCAAVGGDSARAVPHYKPAAPREIRCAGTTIPYAKASLYSRVAGFVDKCIVDIGDVVKKDQLLATISVPEIESQMKIKMARIVTREAEVKMAKAALGSAEAEKGVAEARSAVARAGLIQREAMCQRWQKEYEQMKKILDDVDKKNVEPPMLEEINAHLQDARGAVVEAKAKVREADAAIAVAKANGEKAAAGVEIAQADVAEARAELDGVATLLGFSKMTAPFDGVIAQRSVDPGDFVSPNPKEINEKSPAPFIIVRVDLLRVIVKVPEADAVHVVVGDKVTVRIPGLRDQELTAKVSRTTYVIEDKPGTMLVIIDLPNPNNKIRVGQSASVTIFASE